MKKWWMLAFIFAVTSALAQGSPATADPKADSWSGFWDKLRLKIEQMTPQKKLGTTTAVGGVRGAAVEVADVYWKGEARPQAVDEDELAAFQKAMGLVESRQKDAALAAFGDFSRNFPNSPLKADADQARARLLAGN